MTVLRCVAFPARHPRACRSAERPVRIGRDSLPDTPHQVKVERDIVNGVVDHGGDLVVDVEVPQIGA